MLLTLQAGRWNPRPVVTRFRDGGLWCYSLSWLWFEATIESKLFVTDCVLCENLGKQLRSSLSRAILDDQAKVTRDGLIMVGHTRFRGYDGERALFLTHTDIAREVTDPPIVKREGYSMSKINEGLQQ